MAFRETVTRGNMPHWFMPGAVHFVTYRLTETLPLNVLRRLRIERDQKIQQTRRESPGRNGKATAHKQFFAAYDHYLDRVCKKDWLLRLGVPEIIVENLLHHHGAKYRLLEYTIMSNHVHVLLLPIAVGETDAGENVATGGTDAGSVGHVADAASIGRPDDLFSDEITDSRSPLSGIMHSLKSYTANRINEVLQRSGRLWQPESYDHWVRDEAELFRIAEYMALNPVHAKLVSEPHEWPHGSANLRKHQPERLAEWW